MIYRPTLNQIVRTSPPEVLARATLRELDRYWAAGIGGIGSSASGLGGAASFKPSAGGKAATPVWESSGSISTDTNATGATASVSGTPNTNDILLAHVTITNSSTSTISPPSGEGWSIVARADDTANSDCTCAVYWKRWGSGSTDNTSIAFTGTAGNMRLVITRVSGAHTSGDPFSAGEKATNSGGGAGTGTTLTPATVTADGDSSMGDRLVFQFYSGSATAANISSTTSTTRYSGASYAFTAGVDGCCAMSSIALAGGATSDPTATATCSGTLTNGWGVVTLALNPVGG